MENNHNDQSKALIEDTTTEGATNTRKRKVDEITTKETGSRQTGSADSVSACENSSVPKEITARSVESENSQTNTSTPAITGGFSAYAKTNPFLAAAAVNSNGKAGFGFGSSAPLSSSGFGVFGSGFSVAVESPAFVAAPFTAKPNDVSKHAGGLSISISEPAPLLPSHTSSVGRENFNMPPPLVVPSPKSPKPNPFSSPSPVHNPFMTIVESKDELWKVMAKDKLSDEEAAKSLLFGSATKKSRLANYNGSIGNSYFGGCSYAYNEEEKIKDHSTTDKGDDQANEEDDDDAQEENGDDDDKDNKEGELSPGKMYTTYALPDNVVVVTGEEDDECLFQIRVKLYRLGVKSSGNVEAQSSSTPDNSDSKSSEETKSDAKFDVNSAEWIEVGVGPLKVLRRKIEREQENSPHEDDRESNKEAQNNDKIRIARLVIRREDKKGGIGTKLLMNTRLNQYVSVAKQSDKMIRLICVNGSDPSLQLAGSNQKLNQLQTYLIRMKTVKEFDELMELLKDLIESSKKQ